MEEENEIVEDLLIMVRGKLRANAHKSSWRREDVLISWLESRLDEEVKELQDELCDWWCGKTTAAKVRLECADVAAIVAMIADRVRMADQQE